MIKKIAEKLTSLLRGKMPHHVIMTTCTVMLAVFVAYLSQEMKLIEIQDGEEVKTVFSIGENNLEEIIVREGILMAANDTLEFTHISDNRTEVVINRSFPVTVSADGVTSHHNVTADMTVGDLIASEGIYLDSDDRINLPESFYLSSGDNVIVERVEYVTVTEAEEVPHKTEYSSSSLLSNGRSKVIYEGKEGEDSVTYEECYIDGELYSKDELSRERTLEPVTEKILTGDDSPVSDLDFGVPLDENGIPLQYTRVLENQICTAYSAPVPKNRGAGGYDLFYGYVAVRADEIPYGTKMYIASPDGSYIYGYAIAADTGVGLMQNIIDVDVFYETYLESVYHGRKYVNIYIL